MVMALFEAGHSDVILDACNHNHERRRIWYSDIWVCDYHVVNTPKEECIRRAKELNQDYLVNVIERMDANWEELEGGNC